MEMTKEDLETIYSLKAGMSELFKRLDKIECKLVAVIEKFDEVSKESLSNKQRIEIIESRKSWWSGVAGRIMSGFLMLLIGGIFAYSVEKAKMEESPMQKVQIQNMQYQIDKLKNEIK